MNVHKLPSNIFGLSYIPSLEPELSNDTEILGDLRSYGVPSEVTPNDRMLLTQLIQDNRDVLDLYVEIGVDESGPGSFTRTMLSNKRDDAIYLGIDLNDRMYLSTQVPNVHTLQTDSRNQELIRAKITEFNRPIDLLFIDGQHGVNLVVNDWKYADLVSVGGIVLFHDTNHGCGPRCVMDAIDPEYFDTKYFFEGEKDWGMGYALRKK